MMQFSQLAWAPHHQWLPQREMTWSWPHAVVPQRHRHQHRQHFGDRRHRWMMPSSQGAFKHRHWDGRESWMIVWFKWSQLMV